MDGKRLKHISGLVSEARGLRIEAEDCAYVFEAVSLRAGLTGLSVEGYLNLIRSHIAGLKEMEALKTVLSVDEPFFLRDMASFALIAELYSPRKRKRDL